MRDHHVRRALHRTVLRRHHADPATLVIDELGLCRGAARVDVAVVNGHLAGYEIKAPADTLRRLPAQATYLNAVLDQVTLVVADRHLHAALGAVPGWCDAAGQGGPMRRSALRHRAPRRAQSRARPGGDGRASLA